MTTCTAAKISSTPATISEEDFLVLAIDCIYNSLAQKYDAYKALIGSNRGNSGPQQPVWSTGKTGEMWAVIKNLAKTIINL